MKSFHRALLFWSLILFLPGRLLAEDIVIGMSAAFTGPSRALGIELYRDVPNIGREQTCGGDAAGL